MESTFEILTSDGIDIKGYHESPESPRALLLLIHGMGEHAGRYSHVSEFFVQAGFAVVRVDLRGHGLSAGKRGHTPSYELLMDDLVIACAKAREYFPEIPFVLYGHSMGGNLVLNYLIRKTPSLDAAVVTSPYLRLAFAPPGWKVALGKLSAGLIPGLTQPTGLDVSAISRDPKIIEAYLKDPLVHDKITASFFIHVHASGPYAILHADQLKVPTLLMHGTSDRITDHTASEELFQNAKGNVDLKMWDGYYHELHNEPEREEVLNHTLSWLNHALLH
jgi:acylglycerol lipase